MWHILSLVLVGVFLAVLVTPEPPEPVEESMFWRKIFEQIQRDEGWQGTPYRDAAGNLTIGFGRNLDTVGISQGEAEILLGNDLRRVLARLHEALPWVVALDDVRRGVLTNLAFNVGIKGLLEFEKMLSALKKRDYRRASEELLDSKYARQVDKRAQRLAKQLEVGEWQ